MWKVALAVALVCATARADEVSDLVTAGQTAAERGDYTQAIASWKRADTLHPRASHACLIGLAYTRRELWAQAELFFARCRQRANAGDPIPDWLPTAEAQLAAKLASTHAVAVTIAVTPATAKAQIAISSFEADETFEPATIHLPHGTHFVTASAPGFGTAKQELKITDDSPAALAVTLALPPAFRTVHSAVPTYLLYAAGALGAAAIGYHVFALRPAHDALADARTNAAYEASVATFTSRREVTLALYAGAAATAAVAVILRHTVFHDREVPFEVDAATIANGAIVTVTWSR